MVMTTVAARTMSEMGVLNSIMGYIIRPPPGQHGMAVRSRLGQHGALDLNRHNNFTSQPPAKHLGLDRATLARTFPGNEGVEGRSGADARVEAEWLEVESAAWVNHRRIVDSLHGRFTAN